MCLAIIGNPDVVWNAWNILLVYVFNVSGRYYCSKKRQKFDHLKKQLEIDKIVMS